MNTDQVKRLPVSLMKKVLRIIQLPNFLEFYVLTVL